MPTLDDLRGLMTRVANSISDGVPTLYLDDLGRNLPRLKKLLKGDLRERSAKLDSEVKALETREEPLSIMSAQQENTRFTIKERMLGEIKKWLVTGILSEHQPEQWDVLPSTLRTNRVLEKMVDEQAKSKLDEIIELFRINDALDTIKKEDALVTTAITTYKNKRRYKLLGADRARMLNVIFDTFNTWMLERQAYTNHELEFEKSRITNKPRVTIIAIIINNT